ncbi:MAG TPA: hypothetical protein VFN35_12360 [Ktedonobacteraceae bacterium]|nr:hypothetical protein [Ktedonobacteraceae bacterium]
MLKRAILWIVPLLIVAVFAVSFVVAPMMSSSAATHQSVTGATTPTPAGVSPSIFWNGH